MRALISGNIYGHMPGWVRARKTFYTLRYMLFTKEVGNNMPIDPEFMNKSIAGEHKGHTIRGEVKPPLKLGVHGTSVAVDHDVCNGDGICISVCPVGVFDWADSPGNPLSDRKSDPVNEPACVFCRACEAQCPVQAIKITEM